MGAATAAVLRLPLFAIALATLLTVQAGTGDEPLIIVGVVVAYLVTLVLSRRGKDKPSSPGRQRSEHRALAPPYPRPRQRGNMPA